MVASAPIARMPTHGWLENLRTMQSDPLALMLRGLALGEDLVQLSFAFARAYVVYDPAVVRQVLVEHPERFGKRSRGSELLRRTLGLSTLTAEGDEWRWRRRLGQPSFKRDTLAALDAPIVAGAKHMADELIAAPGPVDLSHATGSLALSIACTALFGGDLGEDGPVVHEALSGILAPFLAFTTSPVPNLDRSPLPAAQRFRAHRRDLSAVMDHIVARRRARGEPVTDLLQALLDGRRPDGSPLTREDIDAEGVTMLLAGHETTANAMAFTLGLLARHPDVGRRLRAELDAALGDRDPTAADLERLPFLDAVVREGLRLYPPAWIVSRSTNEDVRLGAHDVAAGSFLFVPVYAIHRHPALWEDPEAFDPQRWIDGRADAAKKAQAWLPFSLGQRRCIGEHLGMLEARLVLATVVRRVHLSLVPGQALEAEATVTLRPRGGLWVTARPQGTPADGVDASGGARYRERGHGER